ncbi:MAG TPA: flavin reductase family protein [Nitrososphaerales archaeon]|nr:flavin reductase family protein [Nitrososphaerales archaeon]
MKVDPSLVHRLFYPQVPLVMAAQSGGRVSAMPVVSYASISDSPPLVAVACNPSGFTCKLALKAGSYSLSVLDRNMSDAISLLATISGAKAKDKLADAGLKHHKGTALDVPVIDSALATMECRLSSRRKLGDHRLLVARVEAAYATDAFTDFWNFRVYKPLLYTGWRNGLSTYPGAQV